MDNIYDKKYDGVSLRTVYGWLIFLAALVSSLMLYSTFRLNSTFVRLTQAGTEYIDLEKAANELMDASDYLTENVQRFSLDGKREYMEAYFREAFETNRREEAVGIMADHPNSRPALEQLEEAMRESKALMQREYYAMRLVVEAKGYEDYPQELRNVVLSPEDAALSPEEKMQLATEKVLGEEYYIQKDRIRDSMKNSLSELEKLTRSSQEASFRNMQTELNLVRVIIVIQTLGVVVMIWMTSRLGITPMLKAVERIQEDSTIPVIGANEFRYLARTYNKMYVVYRNSIEHLNYKASHDELTGVYNRAGYDLLVTTLDLSTTYLLLCDVDDFKTINDTHGHETGDKVLKKIARILSRHFRADDYICRIGGDEFVIFMVHAEDQRNELIISKVGEINRELAEDADGLPPVSLSFGIAHGSTVEEGSHVFEYADTALYETKRRGKNGYTFYRD